MAAHAGCKLPSIAVAIPTYLREEVLVQTIRQVLSQEPPADEILIIDQSPTHTPETIARLSEWEGKGLIRLVHHTPPNLPGARNRAIRETHCEIVLFIDDDVSIPKDFVGTHRRNFLDQNVWAIAGRVLQEDLKEPSLARPWPRLLDHRFFPLDSKVRKENVVAFRGCNHSIRVDRISAIGGYDDNYIGWAFREESDLAIRIWKSNGLIIYDPEAWVVHLRAPAGGCRLNAQSTGFKEWGLSFPANYFACRHLFPGMWFWRDILISNVRRYVLRKTNVLRPWRLPWALASYIYAVGRAIAFSIRKGKSLPQSSNEWR
jgi:GT2 family glycosyltransferase